MKTILVDAIDGLIFDDGTIFQGMFDLLETYENSKVILTGANDEQWQKFKLDDAPYEVFTLKHNPEKTDPEYFNILLDKYGLTSSDVIYFEHNPDAVKSAESVGIKSYYYDPAKRNLEALKEFIDESL